MIVAKLCAVPSPPRFFMRIFFVSRGLISTLDVLGAQDGMRDATDTGLRALRTDANDQQKGSSP
jgi:hypothetical protein